MNNLSEEEIARSLGELSVLKPTNDENAAEHDGAPAGNTPEAAPETSSAALPGVFAAIGALPSGALITEEGLARIFGRCTATIKNAVDRGELPRPARLMGKNTWTAGAIVRHHEARLEAESRKYSRLRT